MAAKRFDSVHDFRGAALRRLADAEELVQHPTLNPADSNAATRHLRGAMYLAGYAVECVLKAYLITSFAPAGCLQDADQRLRASKPSLPNLLSAEGHSIGLLIGLTDLETMQTADQRKLIGVVASTWKTEMRYDRSSPSRPQAVAFVRAARTLHNWISSKL